MSRFRAYFVLGLIAMFGIPATVSEGALAAAAGGSGLSGTLAKNKALRKQQLICDPDEPTGGSISVTYDPAVVRLDSFGFGPGYYGNAFVELEGDGRFLLDINQYLAEPFGIETGYLRVVFSDTPPTQNPGIVTPQAVITSPHGQIPVLPSYTQIDQAGPAAVDTHQFLFSYLPEVPDNAIATYTIFASDNQYGSEDFLQQGNTRIPYDQIAPATVSGNLNAVPVPPAVFMGGATLIGLMYGMRRRRALL